jgi:hypothetical protein
VPFLSSYFIKGSQNHRQSQKKLTAKPAFRQAIKQSGQHFFIFLPTICPDLTKRHAIVERENENIFNFLYPNR